MKYDNKENLFARRKSVHYLKFIAEACKSNATNVYSKDYCINTNAILFTKNHMAGEALHREMKYMKNKS
ncbi:hypothetical protein T12_13473 [Trichinella patagoniensis]|uniref:Uncharacterized protein n=1 Tax=Trichinella patagoniensis TaxID=990121 RepID=A0A0V0ZIH9_9BILA|nr:hypothetical protein T12_13473 [Trichinella patagoniensis]